MTFETDDDHDMYPYCYQYPFVASSPLSSSKVGEGGGVDGEGERGVGGASSLWHDKYNMTMARSAPDLMTGSSWNWCNNDDDNDGGGDGDGGGIVFGEINGLGEDFDNEDGGGMRGFSQLGFCEFGSDNDGNCGDTLGVDVDYFYDDNDNGLDIEVEPGSLVSDGGFGSSILDGKIDNESRFEMKESNYQDAENNKLKNDTGILMMMKEHANNNTLPVVKEKPRRGRKRRYSREEELRKFGPDAFKDLRGTTAAQSRKMSQHEREVMLHKRRLRNRESAARTREKRAKTLAELTKDVEELARKTKWLMGKYDRLVEENRELKEENWCMKLKVKESLEKKRRVSCGIKGFSLEAVTP